jgi:hypothetical protein
MELEEMKERQRFREKYRGCQKFLKLALSYMNHENATLNSKYYEYIELLNKELTIIFNEYLFQYANKEQLIQLLAWCSSYRPMQLHSLLLRFSMLLEKKKS